MKDNCVTCDGKETPYHIEDHIDTRIRRKY